MPENTRQATARDTFRAALEAFTKAAGDLSRAWDELRTDDDQLTAARDYPFEKTFEEVYSDIIDWNSSIQSGQWKVSQRPSSTWHAVKPEDQERIRCDADQGNCGERATNCEHASGGRSFFYYCDQHTAQRKAESEVD
jgi:hypothetical protein